MAITAAAIAGTAMSVAGGVMGGISAGKAQERGYRQAGHQIEEEMKRLREFATAEEEAGAPFRESALAYAGVGQQALPTLVQLALDPEASPQYRLAAREGLNQLQQNFAVRGSPESSAASLAAGRFLEGLAANERNRQLRTLLGVAQLGTYGPQQYESAQERATRLRLGAGQLADPRAQTTGAQGLARAGQLQAAWGGLSGLGRMVSSMGAMGAMGGGGGGVGGG